MSGEHGFVVGVLACRRPDVLWQTLLRLKTAIDHYGPVRVVALVDRPPEGLNERVVAALEHGPVRVDRLIIAERHLDCNGAVHHLLSECFREAERVCLIEEDICVTHDCLTWVAEQLDGCRDDRQVAGVIAFSRDANRKLHSEVKGRLAETRRWPQFGSWGLAMWRRQWDEIKGLFPENPVTSWDYGINEHFKRHDLVTVVPFVSRAENMGFYQGRYCPWRDEKTPMDYWRRDQRLDWTSDMFMPEVLTPGLRSQAEMPGR